MPSDAVESAGQAAGQAEQAAEALGYELGRADVDALLGFASSLTVEMYVVIALLLLIAGLLFAGIATRLWKVG